MKSTVYKIILAEKYLQNGQFQLIVIVYDLIAIFLKFSIQVQVT